jgi:hypothetical protein
MELKPAPGITKAGKGRIHGSEKKMVVNPLIYQHNVHKVGPPSSIFDFRFPNCIRLLLRLLPRNKGLALDGAELAVGKDLLRSKLDGGNIPRLVGDLLLDFLDWGEWCELWGLRGYILHRCMSQVER